MIGVVGETKASGLMQRAEKKPPAKFLSSTQTARCKAATRKELRWICFPALFSGPFKSNGKGAPKTTWGWFRNSSPDGDDNDDDNDSVLVLSVIGVSCLV